MNKINLFSLYYIIYAFHICLAKFVMQISVSTDRFIFNIIIFLAVI